MHSGPVSIGALFADEPECWLVCMLLQSGLGNDVVGAICLL